MRGYADGAERLAKQQRLQILQAELRDAVRERDHGRVRVTRGGRRLLNSRHHLYETASGPKPLTEDAWQGQVDGWGEEWAAGRLFLTADGEAGAPFGNYTISIDSADGTVSPVLPEPLRRRYANAPRGRYVLDATAVFTHRKEQWWDAVGAARPSAALCPGSRPRSSAIGSRAWRTMPGCPSSRSIRRIRASGVPSTGWEP